MIKDIGNGKTAQVQVQTGLIGMDNMAEITGGLITFLRAEFTGGQVDFFWAKFTGGDVTFHQAEFPPFFDT